MSRGFRRRRPVATVETLDEFLHVPLVLFVESDDRVYMLILSKGTNPGVGARTMTFVKPTASSTNTRIDIPEGCGMLQFAADLASAKPVSVPAKSPWVVDWQDVTRDGQGNAIAADTIDRLLVGFFEGKTVADPVFTGLDECTKDTTDTCIQK